MKRTLILLLVLLLGIANTSFAGVNVLSDKAMDDVNAGDWVVLNDNTPDAQVVDVYKTNNTLWLLEDSQRDLKAVSNANTIDSAVAVQTNIARVTGDTATNNVAVNGKNEANLSNFRPSESSSVTNEAATVLTKAETKSLSEEFSESCELGFSNVYADASSASASSGSSHNLLETLTANAAMAGSERVIGKSGIAGCSIAGVATEDYDKIEVDSSSSAAASASSETENTLLNTAKSESARKTFEEAELCVVDISSKDTVTTRSSQGANNHILLDATSQQTINAVSNLNSVASGAAVQTNIASNVGVSGSISGINTASVSSGF